MSFADIPSTPSLPHGGGGKRTMHSVRCLIPTGSLPPRGEGMGWGGLA